MVREIQTDSFTLGYEMYRLTLEIVGYNIILDTNVGIE